MTHLSSHARKARWEAFAVALAPTTMATVLVAHPFIRRLPDAEAVTDAVAESTAYWGAVHLLTAVGSGLIALAFLALREYLSAAGEDRYSAWALPWVVTSSTLYAFLPGLEFAPLSVTSTGGDAAAAQSALEPWFVSVLVVSAVVFAVGVLGFARAVAAVDGILSRRSTIMVVTALGALALSRLLPLGLVQFYLQALAGLVALWPLALRMWRGPYPHAPSDPRHEPDAESYAARVGGAGRGDHSDHARSR